MSAAKTNLVGQQIYGNQDWLPPSQEISGLIIKCVQGNENFLILLFLYFTKKYFGQRLCCERFDTFNYAWVYNSIRTRGGVDLLVGRGAVHACLVLVPVARLLVQARPPVSITAVFACTCANISSISVCRTTRTDTQFDSTTLLNRKYLVLEIENI